MLLDEIMQKLNVLPPAAREGLVKLAAEYRKGRAWIPNPGPQTDAYYSTADVLLYGGQGGGGKGVPLDAGILTPFGFRPAGKIKEGDNVCATDGTVQRVLRVFPRGVQPVYRLRWHDGTETVCDGDHLWLGWLAGRSRKIANVKTSGEDGARIWTMKEIIESQEASSVRRFAIPAMSAPCRFNIAGQLMGPDKFVTRKIPAYVLGVLLGDGSLTDKAVTFSKPDTEIADWVEDEMAAAGRPIVLSRYTADGKCPAFRFPAISGIAADLAEIDLMGRDSLNKFIPRIYKLGTVEERWALIQGLMDTDGWCDEDGDCYYGTSSPQLAADVADVARSLGALVTIREKSAPKYTYLGETLAGSPAFTLRIKIQDGGRLFRLERKRARVTEPQFMAKFLESIEPAGEQETVCFVVSNPNRLFVVDGYVVTHNTDLLLGLALTEHRKSLIMRRKYANLGGILTRVSEIGGRDNLKASPPPKFVSPDGRQIDFGAAQYLGDEQDWQGNPHDFLGVDEATQMLEAQIRFLMGWVRSTDEGQRKRSILATNPPLSAEGDWVIGMFRPWLDITHPRPAKQGELRWFVTDPDGKDMEVDDGTPVVIDGKTLFPKSRTFIPAALADNPYLINTGYQAELDALPEPIRSAVRDGNFMASRQDDQWQCIPTEWVRAAMRRWTPEPPPGVPQTAIAADVAQGGLDDTVIAQRYDGWFPPLVVVPGKATPDGTSVAGLMVANRRGQSVVVIDMGGGYGGAALEHLRANGVDVVGYKGAEASMARTRDRQYGFYNKRSQAIWQFREALDPAQEGGSPVALPDDPILLADLTAPRFEVGPRGIKIETKEDVCARIGRSPDRGDAVVMCWSEGPQGMAARMNAGGRRFGAAPKVIVGRSGRHRVVRAR